MVDCRLLSSSHFFAPGREDTDNEDRDNRWRRTGPEVATEGLKVLEAVAEKVGFRYETKGFNLSGDRYLQAGGDPKVPSIPVIHDSEIQELRTFDAIYLGAVGHPDIAPGILEKDCSSSCDSRSISTSICAR